MLLTSLVFLLVLSVLVLVHELGHFAVAKKLGIKVEEFGFGLPPRIFALKRGETLYSINALPIGGFVKLYGEDEIEKSKVKSQKSKVKDEDEKNGRAFYARPKKQRAAVVTAGVAMNFLLSVFILSFLFTRGVLMPFERVHIEKVEQDSPAHIAGLKEGDVILFLNDLKIISPDQFVAEIKKTQGRQAELKILRGSVLIHKAGQKEDCGNCLKLSAPVVPRLNPPPGQGAVGVAVSNYETKIYPAHLAPFYGLKEAVVLSFELMKGIISTLGKLITFQSVGKDIAGPVGIARAAGMAARFGPGAVLELTGVLSLNLAIINILPFPALDGGRLLFIFLEKARGRKFHPEWEQKAHQIGMALLLILLLLVTINDIVRIIGR